MGTPHIAAEKGDIAEVVLLPGDPLRAKYAAEKFLEGAVCYTKIRNMFGFTGNYKGKRVSIQGTGMGQPSLSIYATELYRFFGVEKCIRVGTCGAIGDEIRLRDIVLAEGACTDSAINTNRFRGMHFAPTADFQMLRRAAEICEKRGERYCVGNVVSSDIFYDDAENWRLWAQYGVLGAEMEAAELYTLAAKFGKKALAVLTVSDHIKKGGEISAQERQESLDSMLLVALETAISA